jgi:type II secretory pathway component GspD/PulD (secretin)
LDIVDAQEEFAIRSLPAVSGVEEPPAAEAVAEKVGNISVGTFSSPPKDTGQARAIVDVHNGSVVVVAPSSRIERIVSAIAKMLGDKKTKPVEPDKAAIIARSKTEKIETVRPADANEPPAPISPPSPGQPVSEREEIGAGRARTPDGSKQQEPEDRTPSLYEPKDHPNANQVLKIALPEKLTIINLLGLVGEYMNLNFMYDPTKIQGEVTLMLTGDLRGPVKVGDLYPLLESVMRFRGFAMTRRGNLVTIVPIAEAMTTDPVLVETEDDKITEYGHVIVTRVFRLEHIDPTSAQNLLTGMDLGTNVSPIADAGVLFVTGYAYRMPRVERLLKMIDVPGRPKTFKFRPLKYTMATALAPKIKALAEQLGTVSITVGQMSSPSAAPSVSGRMPGELTATYAARVQQERAAAAARMQPGTVRPPSSAAQQGVYLDADERTNRILMIGFEEQVSAVEELIDALDVAQTDLRTLKLYKIEHVDAEQVQRKLQELGIIGGAGAGTSSSSSRITGGRIGSATRTPTTPTAPTGPPAPTGPTGAPALTTTEEGALVEQPQVVIIEATNSLLVNATTEQHTRIAEILKYVDAETDTTTIPYVIYPLENQKPEDLATILEKLIQEVVKDKEGKIEQVIKKTEEEIVIVPDENTFSIIVYASKKNQEWISNLIKTLDKRRPQVLIDVTLVEISKNDKFEYDLNLVQAFPDLTARGLIMDMNEVIPKLTSSGRDHFVEYKSAGGHGTGFYADRHIAALLTAMQAKDYGRILAKPKILVNDNEQGSISTTDTTYVEKKSSIPLSTGTGTTVTTVTTAVDYQGYDAGIKLDITPHISEGELLRLEIALTRSDFGTITGTKPPDTTSSDLTTVVTVPDGSTIILGGMVKMNQGKGGTKVPLLGDLPLVGVLFRSVSNSDLQRRLYIFVKAEIIRPAETLAQGLPDMERISQLNRLAFETFEQEFQRYKSVPGVKSKPVAPAKVLDTE